MNIPLGLAITEVLIETEMPAIAQHHDFYWERDRFMTNALWDYLNMALPPRFFSVHHTVLKIASDAVKDGRISALSFKKVRRASVERRHFAVRTPRWRFPARQTGDRFLTGIGEWPVIARRFAAHPGPGRHFAWIG